VLWCRCSRALPLTNPINKTSTLDGFIKKYQLKFQDPHLRGIGGFLGTLEPMAHEGLFIPEGRENKSIVFFDLDYLNKLGRPRRENGFLVRREDPFELSDRTWKPEDLGNSELIERGLGYSRELWKISTEDFERQVKKTECAEPMPAEVIGIARKLISYYEGIVSRK